MAVGTVSSPLYLVVSHTTWYVELSDSLIPTLCYLCSVYAVDNLRSSLIPCDGPISELRECAASQNIRDMSGNSVATAQLGSTPDDSASE